MTQIWNAFNESRKKGKKKEKPLQITCLESEVPPLLQSRSERVSDFQTITLA